MEYCFEHVSIGIFSYADCWTIYPKADQLYKHNKEISLDKLLESRKAEMLIQKGAVEEFNPQAFIIVYEEHPACLTLTHED